MKGSFTEGLINTAIDLYLERGLAFFQKSYVPSSIVHRSNFFVNAKLKSKSDIDYYGVYRGRYVSFEVKETEKDYFLISNIKDHQKYLLLRLLDFSAISFVIINFLSYEDSAYLIYSDVLRNIFQSNKSKLSRLEVSKIGFHIPLKLPGMLDFLECLNYEI